jgi:hypothetical protein
MFFNRRKKHIKRLLKTYGTLKEDSFDFDLIDRYFRSKDNNNAFQVISDKTCNDLDFNELFMFLDRTDSKIGQQYLYNKLRVVPDDYKNSRKYETIIQKLSNDFEYRISIQKLLSKLNKKNAYYISSLFQDKHLKPPKWFFIVKLLSFASLLSIIMIFFNPKIFIILIGIFIINMGIHYWNKRNLYQYYGSLPLLVRLNSIAKALFSFDKLNEINPDLPESTNTIDKIENRMSFFKLEENMQGDLSIFFWLTMELIKIIFLLEPIFLFNALHLLESRRKEIEDVFEFVGEVDVLVSIASLRKGLGSYCVPTIHKKEVVINAVNMYHPLIPDFVTNSINVRDKSVLITGSNMSGKTSFIRTIGINVITGLAINTCFASEFSMSRMRVYSAIRISDDLMNDKSYYFEEVLTIKEMIEQCEDGVPNLFLLDEIFKGTNTIERISAGKAVLSFLTMGKNIVFVSTHDIELADLLKNEYELHHFSESVDQKNVAFDYKLKDGKLTNRNAIKILKINDYPVSIIDEAMAISQDLDKQKKE